MIHDIIMQKNIFIHMIYNIVIQKIIHMINDIIMQTPYEFMIYDLIIKNIWIHLI